MQKCARLARHVESSMIMPTGTRPRGFRILISLACFGRSPASWAKLSGGSSRRAELARAEPLMKSRRFMRLIETYLNNGINAEHLGGDEAGETAIGRNGAGAWDWNVAHGRGFTNARGGDRDAKDGAGPWGE